MFSSRRSANFPVLKFNSEGFFALCQGNYVLQIVYVGLYVSQTFYKFCHRRKKIITKCDEMDFLLNFAMCSFDFIAFKV